MMELTITELGHLGDGIADGPIYVAGALPGEKVTGELVGDRLQTPKIVTPSSDRVTPPCRHARSCGGCLIQHASDDLVAEWKRTTVEQALRSHGIEANVTGPRTSLARSRRRAGFSARRTKKGAMAGFHARGSDVLISVTDCKLITPSLSGALPMVEILAKAGASRKNELSVMVTDTQTGLDVFVGGGKPLDTKLQFDLAEIARSYDLARITWSDEIAVQRRVPLVDFDGISVPLPPGAFLQATSAGEEALRRFVLDNLQGATHVLDLFSGCGTFSLPLSQQARVHAVENDAGMLNALDQGWRHGNGLKQVTTEQRDLFRNPVLPFELKRFDAVVLDPPRAGASAQVKQLSESHANRIVYVSCNPATFARDASQLLFSGYKMSPIQIVDQFRWSSHVELCASFHRN